MKKMIKLSLVAAVAVAGLTTTASAGNLSDMIQGVQTNGFVRYRNTDKSFDNTAKDANGHEYKIVLDNKMKVNDKITANIKLVMLSGKTNVSSVDHNSTDVQDVNTQADHDLDVTRANFTYAHNKDISATYGIQGYNLPITNDSEAQGLKAQATFGPATIIAATFNPDLDDATQDINAAAAIVKAGPATITALVANQLGDTDLTTTYLNAKAKVANVNISVTQTNADTQRDAANNKNNPADDVSLTSLVASTKVAGIGLAVGFAKTGKDGGNTHIADGGPGDRAKSQFALIRANAGDFKDATVTLVKASKKVGPVNLTLGMASASATGKTSATETVVKAAYAMSKNFKVSGWVSNIAADADNADSTFTRLEVKYTF